MELYKISILIFSDFGIATPSIFSTNWITFGDFFLNLGVSAVNVHY